MIVERTIPLVRGAVKKGGTLTYRLQRAVHEVREDIQDLMAEASATVKIQAEGAAERGTRDASSDFLWLRTSSSNGHSRQKSAPISAEDVVGS